MDEGGRHISSSDENMTPMLETLLERINALTSQVETIRAGMIQGFQQVRRDIQLLNKKLEIMHQDALQVRAEQRLLEDRVDKPERKPS